MLRYKNLKFYRNINLRLVLHLTLHYWIKFNYIKAYTIVKKFSQSYENFELNFFNLNDDRLIDWAY